MKKHSLVIVVLLSLATMALWGCTRQENATPRETNVILRLAYRPLALADVTPVIMKESGRIASDGVRVELVAVPSPQIALQRFDAGEVDAIAGLTMESVLQRIADQKDPGFLAFYFQVDIPNEGWVSLVANRRLGNVSVKDLSGKTVASLPTDQARWLVRRILLSSGIPPEQVKISDYNPSAPLLGLESGEHDALFGLEPAISRAAAQGHSVIAKGPVSQYLYNGQPVPLSASVIRKSFVREHPDAYKAFLGLYRAALDHQKARPDEVRAYFSKNDYGALDENVRKTLAFSNLVEPVAPGVVDTLKRFIADLRQAGVLKNDIDVTTLISQ
ncbi:MAG: ABC transporter substrate-binding protein [Cyanobacteria bacterium]|nr:ABC transporter substrate-binding protein [Cyanobacteriota bacterium]